MRPAPLRALAAFLGMTLLLLLAACAATNTRPSASVPTPASGVALVADAASTVRSMRAKALQQSLDYLLEDARGVVVLPGVFRAGYIVSVQGGNGVLLRRLPTGAFGNPVFCSVGGAGLGVQICLEHARMLLVLHEDAMVEQVLSGDFSLETAAWFDVLGVQEEKSSGPNTRGAPVTLVVDGTGVMAGVALRGGVLRANQSLTDAYYGTTARLPEVLSRSAAQGLEVHDLWDALKTSLPQQTIQRGPRRP